MVAVPRLVIAAPASGCGKTTVACGLMAALQSFHAGNPDLPGIGLERLRLQLQPRLPTPAFLPILHALVRSKDIALDGARLDL